MTIGPDSRNRGCSRHRSDPFDLSQALALLAVAEEFTQSQIKCSEASIQFYQFCTQFVRERWEQFSESRSIVTMISASRFRSCVMSRAMTIPCSECGTRIGLTSLTPRSGLRIRWTARIAN